MKGRKYVCPKCGRKGTLTRRWVRSSYRPKSFSWLCDSLDRAKTQLKAGPNLKNKVIQLVDQKSLTSSNEIPRLMKLGEYVDKMREQISGSKYSLDKKDREAYVIRSKKKYYYYIGHYDSDVYQKQMISYKNGKRKSRPNGRRWCKLPTGIHPHLVAAVNK
jgi:hypothetical protein